MRGGEGKGKGRRGRKGWGRGGVSESDGGDRGAVGKCCAPHAKPAAERACARSCTCNVPARPGIGGLSAQQTRTTPQKREGYSESAHAAPEGDGTRALRPVTRRPGDGRRGREWGVAARATGRRFDAGGAGARRAPQRGRRGGLASKHAKGAKDDVVAAHRARKTVRRALARRAPCARDCFEGTHRRRPCGEPSLSLLCVEREKSVGGGRMRSLDGGLTEILPLPSLPEVPSTSLPPLDPWMAARKRVISCCLK